MICSPDRGRPETDTVPPAWVPAGSTHSAAVSTTVIAYNTNTAGGVSASFGVVEAPIGRDSITQTRTVRIQNTGDAPVEPVAVVRQPDPTARRQLQRLARRRVKVRATGSATVPGDDDRRFRAICERPLIRRWPPNSPMPSRGRPGAAVRLGRVRAGVDQPAGQGRPAGAGVRGGQAGIHHDQPGRSSAHRTGVDSVAGQRDCARNGFGGVPVDGVGDGSRLHQHQAAGLHEREHRLPAHTNATTVAGDLQYVGAGPPRPSAAARRTVGCGSACPPTATGRPWATPRFPMSTSTPPLTASPISRSSFRTSRRPIC